jgi:hypothetical protein
VVPFDRLRVAAQEVRGERREVRGGEVGRCPSTGSGRAAQTAITLAHTPQGDRLKPVLQPNSPPDSPSNSPAKTLAHTPQGDRLKPVLQPDSPLNSPAITLAHTPQGDRLKPVLQPDSPPNSPLNSPRLSVRPVYCGVLAPLLCLLCFLWLIQIFGGVIAVWQWGISLSPILWLLWLIPVFGGYSCR